MDSSFLRFGEFALHRQKRQLSRGDKRIGLAPAALDVLEVLVAHAGELLADSDILLEVLRPMDCREVYDHVVSLNTALQAEGCSHLALISDRGYKFIGPVAGSLSRQGSNRLIPKRIVGRTDTVQSVAASLRTSRLVTLVGAGGVGKTTAAQEVVRLVAKEFDDGVCMVDLATLSSGAFLAASVAMSLGLNLDLTVGGADSVGQLARATRNRRGLVVFDNCEHLIDDAAQVVEALLTTPHLKVLTTSREGLRIAGEVVHLLRPLAVPDTSTTVQDLMGFGAMELFVDRLRAASPSTMLDEDDYVAAAEICRRVDGIPLAIELAAGNVGRLGVKRLLESLNETVLALQPSRSSPSERHRTIQAALDWSYALLSDNEKLVFNRLFVFRGEFTLDSAIEVASDTEDADGDMAEAVLALAAKSMVSTSHRNGTAHFRLLELAKLYAAEKVTDDEELRLASSRHARDCIRRLRQAEKDWHGLSRSEWWSAHGSLVDDVRAALAWAQRQGGDAVFAATLVLESIPVAGRLSLLHEFSSYMREALARVEGLEGDHQQVQFRLTAALGEFQFFSQDSESSKRSLDLAKSRSKLLTSDEDQMGVIVAAWANAHVGGNYPEMERMSRTAVQRAAMTQKPSDLIFGWRGMALSLHYRGDYASSIQFAERALSLNTNSVRPSSYYLQTMIDREVAMRVFIARSYWITGRPDDAVHLAEEALAWAKRDRPVAVCVALAVAFIPISLWRGDVAGALRLLSALEDAAETHGLEFGKLWARLFRYVIHDTGSADMASGLQMQVQGCEQRGSAQEIDMLATLHGAALSDLAIARVNQGLVGWCAPEVLRRQAMAHMECGNLQAAETLLVRALDLARFQGAASWELRCALTLGKLWSQEGCTDKSMRLVGTTTDKFTQGFETVDLVAAQQFLEGLDKPDGRVPHWRR